MYLRILTCVLAKFNVCTCEIYQGAVARWRKCESYIAAYRLWRDRDEYRRWKDFCWSDFQERDKLRKTYYARHAKYSDGNDHPCFDGLVTVPPQWDKGRNEKVLPKRKKKKKEKESSIAATASPKATPTKRIWDFESSQFVELITIED